MQSPIKKMVLRGNDPTGHGHYGAKRGRKKHKGLDLAAVQGEDVVSPIHGVVTKLGYPYSFALQFRYVEISNDVYRVRLMYVAPLKKIKVGIRLFEGDLIGQVQHIAGYWNQKMTNHVHIEVYKYGLLTDPEPLLVCYNSIIS